MLSNSEEKVLKSLKQRNPLSGEDSIQYSIHPLNPKPDPVSIPISPTYPYILTTGCCKSSTGMKKASG